MELRGKKRRHGDAKIEAVLATNLSTAPYFPGSNTVPYTKRDYELLFDYELTDQLKYPLRGHFSNLLKAEKPSLPPCCQISVVESVQLESCQQLFQYDPITESFKTDSPCLQRKVGCSASLIHQNRSLALGQDLDETNVWGLDTYVCRNVQAVLDSTSIQEPNLQEAFISRLLIPVCNFLPDEVGFYLRYAFATILALTSPQRVLMLPNDEEWESILSLYPLNSILHSISPKLSLLCEGFFEAFPSLGREAVGSAAETLVKWAKKEPIASFRAHPKGVGVRCLRKEGIPYGRFIQHYLGEIFPPWRWFEKQDAIKRAQRKLKYKPLLPDFYNIMLEKHSDDFAGYDIVFVDPIMKGNYASRLSHSCKPNCATVAMVAKGSYTVALFALRNIHFGEELTFDYNSVTEDINEYKAAICLCSNVNSCRGSFLHYFGSSAFTAILEKSHSFLDRTSFVLVSSVKLQFGQEGKDILERFSLRKGLIQHLPPWLLRWILLTLTFVEAEEVAIVDHLLTLKHKQTKKAIYNRKTAEQEARALREKRKQHVVITISKVRHFLMLHLKAYKLVTPSLLAEAPPPLRFLSDEVIAERLWNNGRACLRGSLPKLCKLLEKDAASSFVGDVIIFSGEINLALDTKLTLLELKGLLRKARRLVKIMIEHRSESEVNLYLAFDILSWLMHTRYWFTSEKYSTVTSPRVRLRNIDIGHDGCVVDDSIKSTFSILEGRRHREKADTKRIDPLKIVYSEEKKYPGLFVWGQLSGWFKQTVTSPWATISSVRRTSILLPNLFCSFLGAKKPCMPYASRKKVLQRIQEHRVPSFHAREKWQHRNPLNIFGSPWMDEKIDLQFVKWLCKPSEKGLMSTIYQEMSSLPTD